MWQPTMPVNGQSLKREVAQDEIYNVYIYIYTIGGCSAWTLTNSLLMNHDLHKDRSQLYKPHQIVTGPSPQRGPKTWMKQRPPNVPIDKLNKYKQIEQITLPTPLPLIANFKQDTCHVWIVQPSTAINWPVAVITKMGFPALGGRRISTSQTGKLGLKNIETKLPVNSAKSPREFSYWKCPTANVESNNVQSFILGSKFMPSIRQTKSSQKKNSGHSWGNRSSTRIQPTRHW